MDPIAVLLDERRRREDGIDPVAAMLAEGRSGESVPADPYSGLPPDLVRNMSSIGLRHRGEEDLPEIPLFAFLRNVNELSSGLIGGTGSLAHALSFAMDKIHVPLARDFLGNAGTWLQDTAQEQAVWGRNLWQDEYDSKRPPTFAGKVSNALGSSGPSLLASVAIYLILKARENNLGNLGAPLIQPKMVAFEENNSVVKNVNIDDEDNINNFGGKGNVNSNTQNIVINIKFQLT
jgi:hypothetical protein